MFPPKIVAPLVVALSLAICLALMSCAPLWTSAPITQSAKYAVHICKAGDTFEGLSLSHYGTRDKAWLIKEFNGKENISDGDEIIIPILDVSIGGIRPWGYQVVPVLCYHELATGSASQTAVTVESFERQMAFLKDNGYYAISLEDFFSFLHYSSPLPEKSVVITFDDAWMSFYQYAYPILKRYEFTATLFIPTDFIGATFINTDAGAMSWKNLEEASRNGFDIQSRTKSRAKLIKNADETYPQYQARLLKEFSESKKIIEQRIKKPVKYLSYPAGTLNADIVAMAKTAGYEGGVTVNPAPNPFFTCNFAINRTVIDQNTSLESFAAMLKYVERESLTGYAIIP